MNSQLMLNALSVCPTQKCASKAVTQAMASRHVCPCCCTILLRHARPGEIYWRCSSCYQEMPV
jgi:ribosomal protein L37AE/L43A